MATLLQQAGHHPARMKGAPYTTPVRRLDDVKAARELDLAYRPERGTASGSRAA